MKNLLIVLFAAVLLFAAAGKDQTVKNQSTWQPISTDPRADEKITAQNDADMIPAFTNESRAQFVPISYGDATKIAFSNGISFDTKLLGKNGEPELPDYLKLKKESGYYIVQFNGPIYAAQKEWLAASGAEIHSYIPDYGFIVGIKDLTTADIIRAHPSVNWLGNYQPAYKLSNLFDRVGEEHKITVLLFMDADINSILAEVKDITTRSEFTVSDNGINKMIQGIVNKEDLIALANVSGIYWIEPYLQPVTHNSYVQCIVQSGNTTTRNIWAQGIRGEGEIINHCDSGINCSHYQHRSGSAAITTWGVYPTHIAICAYDSGATSSIVFGDGFGASYHGTHTGGTSSGDDTTLGTSAYDGVAKRAKIYHNDCGDNTNTSIYTFGDLNDLYIRSYNKYYASNGIRAYMSTNSWGSSAAGAYISNSLNVDQFMWSHRDFLLCFSNGNDGSAGTGAPATAKNCLSVGATDNGSAYTSLAGYSSWGPCTDGRYKPTICTPGGYTISVTSSTSGTGTYGGLTGTSMACPGAAGSAALARQYLREGWYPTGKKVAGNAWSYISAAVLKAMLINSADPNIGSYTVPSNQIGWGRVDLDSVLFFSGETRKLKLDDDTIGVLTGEYADYHFNLPSGATNLKITVVWTDYPGNPAASRMIVNDLDLYASAGGTYYRGNQYSSGQSVANPPGRDSINVEECIRRNAPTSGDWLVRVEGRNVPYGPQPYALVISYSASTVAGVVCTDKPVYRANDFTMDTVRVRVEDPDFGTVGIRDTVRVVISGKYIETQPETLRCVELAESSYVFKGEIPLLFRGATHGDGRLSACQGDTLTVSYYDASAAYTSTTWAAVDAYYFNISNVHTENMQPTTSEVCWTSNENSNSKVYYGTDPGNLNQSAIADTPYVLPHRLRLSGLNSSTIYFYDVESRDFRGNVVRDNNGGAHYSFKTKSASGTDILVVIFNNSLGGSDFTHPDFLKNALNAGGWTYDWWSTRADGQYTRNNLKGYKAIYFQVGHENYPVWTVAQKETIKLYHNGGARFAVTGHEIAWDPWRYNPSSDTLFCKDYLHFRYIGDVTATSWNSLRGISGDPISGPYTAGVTYQPYRSGAAGDSIRLSGTGAAGTGTYVWHGNVANDSCGIKWESQNAMGTPGDGIWGGQNTRVVANAFEITQIDTAAPNSVTRTNILNNMFIWLIGHDHPDVTVTSPVGGNTYNSSPVNIAWTATTYGGTYVDTTWLEYSPNAGNTWYLITSGTGITSPYSWNISALQNGTRYRVRVTISDGGVYPSMKGLAETGNFTIVLAGNDDVGPKVIPNSIIVSNNPKFVTPTDTLMPFTAIASDSETGLSTIGAASYRATSQTGNSSGEQAMSVQDGSWDEIQETVNASIRFVYTPGVVNICTLSVRARDNAAKALNWGGWFSRTFTVIDGDIRPLVGVDEFGARVPVAYAFGNPIPNPSVGSIRITYALPNQNKVSLKIYNSAGQLVRTAVKADQKAGYYTYTWDGRDDTGRNLASGIYFYKFETDEYQDTKKAVLLR